MGFSKPKSSVAKQSHDMQEWCFTLFFRAADWKLDEPAWTGRMKIISIGKLAYIKLEDKNSGRLTTRCPTVMATSASTAVALMSVLAVTLSASDPYHHIQL